MESKTISRHTGQVGKILLLTGKNDSITNQQIWLRSTTDENGWFTMTNLASGKVLTASSTADVIVTGDKF